MPNFASTTIYKLYAMNMVITEIIIAGVNLRSFFRSSGNTKKKIREGRTTQKILVDRSMTFCTFFVSLYSQMMARIDISGSEASMAATGVNFLPSSDTPAMMSADTTILMMYCISFFKITLILRPIPPYFPQLMILGIFEEFECE